LLNADLQTLKKSPSPSSRQSHEQVWTDLTTYQSINVTTVDFVTTITMHRPERLNALTLTMANELFDALHQCDRDDATRVFVITGAGRAFSAGADLTDPGADTTQSSNSPTLAERLYQAFADIEKPIIAAINGAAVGGGCTMTLLCDIRLAAESARFQFPFTKLGISAEIASTYTLPKLIGAGKAMELMLTSKMIEAPEALEIGLINQCVADEELLEVTMEMATVIAGFPPLSVRTNKATLKQNADIETQFRTENMALAVLKQTHDAKEAAAAFREKRPPVFTGR